MDYKLCTVEELAEHFVKSPTSRVTQQLIHYRKQGNQVMVEKILAARRLAKRIKLEKELESMND